MSAASRNKGRRGQQEAQDLLKSRDWSVAELNSGTAKEDFWMTKKDLIDHIFGGSMTKKDLIDHILWMRSMDEDYAREALRE